MADDYPCEKCACGRLPVFDWFNEPDGRMSFYACPPAPRGCGRAGPMIAGEDAPKGKAAAAWDRMRRADHKAADAWDRRA